MKETNFNNLIIISNYDSGYNQTIWMDGIQVYAKDKIVFGDEPVHPLKEEVGCGYLTKAQIKKILKKYKKSLLICENGSIEYYPYSEK